MTASDETHCRDKDPKVFVVPSYKCALGKVAREANDVTAHQNQKHTKLF